MQRDAKQSQHAAELPAKEPRAGRAKRKVAKQPRPAKQRGKRQRPVKVEDVSDVALDPERDIAAETEALARLAACDFGPFIERVKADAGFIFETDALKALSKLMEKSRADFARLRARLEKEVKFRRLVALEAAMRSEAGTDGGNGDGLPGRPIVFDDVEPCPHPVDGAELLDDIAAAIGEYVVMAPY